LVGIIPAENLKEILCALPDTDEEDVDAMIAAIDDDGNGEVSFDGEHLCRFQTPAEMLASQPGQLGHSHAIQPLRPSTIMSSQKLEMKVWSFKICIC